MYLDYYGLTEAPFDISPNPRFLFYSVKHREAFNHLLYGIRERKGFVQLTGEVGAGKTTLCRALLEELDARFSTALILNPVISAGELLKRYIAREGRERSKHHQQSEADGNADDSKRISGDKDFHAFCRNPCLIYLLPHHCLRLLQRGRNRRYRPSYSAAIATTSRRHDSSLSLTNDQGIKRIHA